MKNDHFRPLKKNNKGDRNKILLLEEDKESNKEKCNYVVFGYLSKKCFVLFKM